MDDGNGRKSSFPNGVMMAAINGDDDDDDDAGVEIPCFDEHDDDDDVRESSLRNRN